MSYVTVIELPSPQVGPLLAELLVEEPRDYVTDFHPEWTSVSLTSETGEGVQQAEANVRAMVEDISHKIRTRTEYLHPSCVPLFCSAWGERAIASIEELYHVQISFTGSNLPLQLFSRIVPSNNLPALLCLEHLCDVTVPVLLTGEETVALSPNVKVPAWFYGGSDGNFSPFTLFESQELEKLFQYGGYQVRLSDHLCTVDLKEMKVIGASGKMATVQRIPPSAIPERRLMVNIKGLQLYATNAMSNLKERLDKEFKSSCIVLNSTGQPVSSHSQQQITNYCRQYCVKFSFENTNGQHMLHLSGPEGYVHQLRPLVEVFVRMLDANVVPHIQPLSPTVHQAAFLPVHGVPSTCNNPPGVRPSSWTPQTTCCAFFPVAQGSPEWNQVVSLVRRTLPALNIQKVERVQNRTLWQKYKLEGEQMSERNNGQTNEKLLFHGTNATDPYQIARSDSGIDFRCSTRERKLMWGSGAYFAENARYSDSYAYRLSDETTRQMMIVSVLTGIPCQYGKTQNPELTKPPDRVPGQPGQLYDTVKGHSGGSDIYVVYDHCKSCPAYIITYNK